jgi:hypothetical protein
MCVVSMVHDHYWKRFDELQRQWQPSQTDQIQWTLPTTLNKRSNVEEATEELRDLIKEFRELVAAAKRIDTVTGQPDCVDPEKAKLEERVAALERQLSAMKEALG